MYAMFNGADIFNGKIGSWDVSKCDDFVSNVSRRWRV